MTDPGPTAAPHILVVDDDASICELLARVLADYRVSVAQDGPEALTILRREPVDLLITDYLMPGMTGQQLIET
ncbi:MAG TPA: response regulator, partial [Vicinamibacterales bacterium]|nr:response regulator [Vicinamibacterales bacterium]